MKWGGRKEERERKKCEFFFFDFFFDLCSLFFFLSLSLSFKKKKKTLFLTHRRRPGQPQARADRLVRPLRLQQQRHPPDVLDVVHRQHVRGRDLAEERELVADGRLERRLGAAGEEVGRDAERAEHADRVLRRLGLLLPDDAQDGHERDVHGAEVVGADAVVELAERLDKGGALDVSDGSSLRCVFVFLFFVFGGDF